jgi:hypothetical protein
LSNKGVGASLGYRYLFEGKESAPDDAVRIVKGRGTVGWTWEPKLEVPTEVSELRTAIDG